MTRLRSSCLLLSAATVTLILAAGSAGEAGAAVGGISTAKAVEQTISDEGRARVVVRLRTQEAYRSEHGLARAALMRQRADIAAAQRRVREALRGAGYRLRRQFATVPYMALEIDAGALARLQAATSDVAGIYVDEILRPSLAESLFQVEADLAHGAGLDGSGSAVVVIDTGSDAAHPFLAGKVMHEACFALEDDGLTGACPNGQGAQIGTGAAVPCDFDPDACFHGTHVAGIAVGAGTGSTGVAPGATLIPIQVFHPSSYCGAQPCAVASTSDVAAALEHVYDIRDDYPIAAVNMSLGGGIYSGNCDAQNPLVLDVINNLKAAGIATVVASGNNAYPGGISSPACVSSAISVGAVDETDAVAWFSNVSEELDLFAPGTRVVSSVPGGGFESYSGTSMATPHVAGAWAILQQADPAATVDDRLDLLKATGRPVTDTRSTAAVTRSRIRLGPVAGVQNPVPALSSVSPQTVVAWRDDTALTVSGSGFVRSSAVTANGAAIPTAFVSDTALSATLPDGLLRTGATSLEIRVQSPPLGGGISSPLSIELIQPELVLGTDSAVPGQTISVTLTNAPGRDGDWLAFARTTAPDSNYLDFVDIPVGSDSFAWDVSAPSAGYEYEFRLYSQGGFERIITSASIAVNYPVPVLTAVSPDRAAAYGAALSVSVSGTDFVPSSAVHVNGVARTTTYHSPTSLSVLIPASDLASDAPSLDISVKSSAAGSVASNTMPLMLVRPVLTPSATSVTPGQSLTLSISDSPANAGDWVSLVRVGAADNQYLQWTYLPAGVISPSWTVTMPSTPGDYEFRLYDDGYTRVGVSAAVTVAESEPEPPPPPPPDPASPTLDVSAVIAAPGDSLVVTMTDGPGNARDWLALAAVGSPDSSYIRWTYVPSGATSMTWTVTLPTAPGNYEVRLFEDGGYTRLATSAPITVEEPPPEPTDATLSLSATETEPGGQVIVTLSDGPGNARDWLALASVGSPDSSYIRWTYVPSGATSTTWTVTLPSTPGDYEIRLFENNGYTRLATSDVITVREATPEPPPESDATLSVSATQAAPGGQVLVTLSAGPGNARDWLALASVGSPDSSYLQWTYVPSGASSMTWTVTMPATPGDYEVRLFENNGYTRLATSATITVSEATPEPPPEPASPSLSVSATAAGPGAQIVVTLSDGPGNARDWLALAGVGSPDSNYIQWTYVPSGATSATWTVTMPSTAGDYEIRLFENNGFTRLATSETISVTP